LCKRYGWSIGSDVPHKYIHKAGIDEKEVVEKFKKETVDDLENELDKIKEQNKFNSDEFEEFKKLTTQNDKQIAKFLKLLKKNPKALNALVEDNKDEILEIFGKQ